METVYNTAVGYERMKMYTTMGICIILGIIIMICAIISMMNPPPPEPKTNTPSPQPTSSSTVGWLWLILFGILCFLTAYGCYYMASNKSMENVLAAQGAIDAASTVSSMFNHNKGGMFEVGE